MGQTIHPFGGTQVSVETEFCGRKLSIETGRLAFRSSGAVTVRYGDTVVLGTAVLSKHATSMDYLPLMIDYEEKLYAAGKISGSRFMKREGRASDRAVLAARLIDRPIRPLFPKGMRNEAQGIATVLSLDEDAQPDLVAMTAISAAFMLSGAPFEGPVAGVRVGHVDGSLVVNPTAEQLDNSKLDLVVAGTAEGIMMVEAGANEVDEQTMAEAIELAHKEMQTVIKLQNELIEKIGVEKKEIHLIDHDEELVAEVKKHLEGKLGENVRSESHQAREEAIDQLRDELLTNYEEAEGSVKHAVKEIFEKLIDGEVRRAILEEGIRPDGRAMDQVRPISSEVGVLPRTHGSSIFTRGSTQSLNIITLASPSYGQLLDSMEEDFTKHFMHHYNFPPYSVGDARPMRGPGRREVGHGMLAERAVAPVIPAIEEFPYTIRAVSEITTSSGSTSMAAVCSTTLSLMDAGVPIKAPVSGIAMGLMTDGDKNIILTDIQDAEDFAGDMDFKVAGTEAGITAVQMDIKIKGLSPSIMKDALEQAKVARASILATMLETLSESRTELSQYAPQIEKIKVNPEKIGAIIGKGGETINKITAETGAEIDIEDDGLVIISAPSMESIQKAKEWIEMLTTEPEVGRTYDATIVKVMEFGAFAAIAPGVEGLVHISELANERVEQTSDVVSEGDKVRVKLIAIDERGRLNLSIKKAE